MILNWTKSTKLAIRTFMALVMVMGVAVGAAAEEIEVGDARFENGKYIIPLEKGFSHNSLVLLLPEIYAPTDEDLDAWEKYGKLNFVTSTAHPHPESLEAITIDKHLAHPRMAVLNAFYTYVNEAEKILQSWGAIVFERHSDIVGPYKRETVGGFYKLDDSIFVHYVLIYGGHSRAVHWFDWSRKILPGETPHSVMEEIKQMAQESVKVL